ncbi:hypothetical protein ITX54_16435 [Rouxiella silvae]|uniref:GNAT family N-acetyltransferase n=1 Tax=Rouxiella silvae TaxID=1646373 RepID=A0AA40X4M2_9GAMM|nr:hypothetical protein [Rouxiella silvae]MBF6638254.1 hypothetical protein [Rouxiella silvae]
MDLLRFLSGWTESSFETYKQAYTLWGGNTVSNPEILNFLHQRFDLHERFYIKRNKKEELIGGVCVWNNTYIAGDPAIVHSKNIDRYPLSFDEIILPIKPDTRVILPFHSKFLSQINSQSVRNCSHLLDARRKICIVRSVSAKTRSSRNRDLKKFINAGGSIHDTSEYSIESLFSHYRQLFYQRRGVRVNTDCLQELMGEIEILKFGKILAMCGEPCAIQLMLRTQDNQRIYLDGINTGMSMQYPHLSIGTLAAWVNICAGIAYGKSVNKNVRISFGRPTAEYKDYWCKQENLYRCFSF